MGWLDSLIGGLAKGAGESIGKALGKATDYIQGRSERRRNDIDTLKRKIDDLEKQPSTSVNVKLMSGYLKRLRELEENAANAA